MKSMKHKHFCMGCAMMSQWLLRAVIAVSLAVSLAACVAVGNKGQSGFLKNYGYLSQNDEVTAEFESYTVNPEYNYYFTGPDQSPRAVIGIKKDVELVAKFWKPESVTAGRLKNWMWWMNLNHNQSFSWQPRGYIIIDPEGKPAGVWYSACDFTVIKRAADGGLTVYTPVSGPCFPRDKGDSDNQSSLDVEPTLIPERVRAASITDGGHPSSG